MVEDINTPFYDGQDGAQIKTELNKMWALWLLALEQAQGPQGWSPLPALEQDGPTRVVMKVQAWIAGQGVAPTDLGYIGTTGLVPTKAAAVNILGGSGREVELNTDSTYIRWRYVGQPTWTNLVPLADLKGDVGRSVELQKSMTHIQWRVEGDATWTDLIALADLRGTDGEDGTDGTDGSDAWTYVLANVSDGNRVVQQVVDWFGGTGEKPNTGQFLGSTGLVGTAAEATNVRGAPGDGDGDVRGPASSQIGRLALFTDGTGKIIGEGPLPSAFATSAQGELADTAVQPADLTSALAGKANQVDVDNAIGAVEAIANAAIPASEKASANGVATLDADGKLPFAQVPAVAISVPYVVNTEAAQLALTAQVGDTAIRTDIEKNFIHNGGTSGTMADWTELITPTSQTWSSLPGKPAYIGAGATQYLARAAINAAEAIDQSTALTTWDAPWGVYVNNDESIRFVDLTEFKRVLNIVFPVTSVAGKTGAVTLVKDDVGLGNVDNTSDSAKPVSAAQDAAIRTVGMQNRSGNFTLAASDVGTAIYYTTSNGVITVPHSSTVALPIGAVVFVINGTGGNNKISFSGAGGVGVWPSGKRFNKTQDSTFAIMQTALNTWHVVGGVDE